MSSPLLSADGLYKSFPMGPTSLEVLRRCDLRVEAGEFVAIMGASGSGKSTLLHILGALDVPQRGQVYFRGEPVFAPPAERRRIHLRRTQFGFVFQFYHLLPELNVLENVLMTRMVACSSWQWLSRRRDARQGAVDILTRVGLAERLKHRPSELSGGERQRVAIARALVHKPRIVYADEPTGNLDAEAGANIMSLLEEFHGAGQTIVMVTHDASIAQYADRTILLKDGRLHAA